MGILSLLSEYVRNLGMFLLFMTFVSIITPNSKYKGYINLIMGFMLIFVIISPISNVVASSFITLEDIFAEVGIEINSNNNMENITTKQEFFESSQRAIILDSFKRDLIVQIEGILQEKGFSATKVSLDIDDSEEKFGDIKSIYIHMIDMDKEENRTSIIQIERISINRVGNIDNVNSNDEMSQSEEVKNLKNYISDFYNLSVDNIYIVLQG